jgi:flagellin
LNAYQGAGTAGVGNIFTGTFTLQSSTSSPITVGTTQNGNINKAGLMAGTYAANTSYSIGTQRASWATSAAGNAAILNAGDLVINGVSISGSLASDDNLSAGAGQAANKDSSAIAIAAAINKSSALTGVKAVAQANVVTGSGWVTSSASDTMFLNGQSIAINTTSSSKAIDIVNQINAYSTATGVVASDNGDGISLVASDGRNIELGMSGTAFTAAKLGLGQSAIDSSSSGNNRNGTLATGVSAGGLTAVFAAGVTLVSDKTFTVSAGQKYVSASNNSLSNLARIGLTEGTFGGSNNGTKISGIDISSVSGAQDALNAVDAALNQISDQRSNLGAVQNRLQSAVDNLTSSSTNLQAAQGRIQDTDYSSTTTQMSKSQIIAQAATAMLAQANQQPQMVLSLLK